MHNTSNPDLYIEVFSNKHINTFDNFHVKTLYIFEKFNSQWLLTHLMWKKEIVDAMKKSHESRL